LGIKNLRLRPKLILPTTFSYTPVSNEFTDATKAAIFARDRATCCFSGANLWLPISSLGV